MRRYIKRNRHEVPKKKISLKPHIVALCVIIAVLTMRFTVIPFMENKLNYVPSEFEYSGVVDFWDISALTVKGSKYSVIQTICSEYAQMHSSFRMNFTAISERSASESVLLNINRGNVPDIIRLKIEDYEANRNIAISDSELAQHINSLYEPYISRSNPYGDKLIIDMYCDISLILINKDVAETLNVSYNMNEIQTKDGFLSFLEKLSANNITEAYNVIDFPADNIYAYLPFTVFADCSYSTDYLSRISAYLPSQHSSRSADTCLSDFFSGKTAVYCADLDTLNTLIRRETQNRGFAFDYCLYPYDDEKIIFVNDITSYVFNENKDPDKNTVLKDFALYMLSDNALQYTQNLGKLNCTTTVFDYENYPHMKGFKDEKAVYFTYRDAEIKGIYAKLSSFYKGGN